MDVCNLDSAAILLAFACFRQPYHTGSATQPGRICVNKKTSPEILLSEEANRKETLSES